MSRTKKRAPNLGELLATLQAEADHAGRSIVKQLEGGATVQYRSKVEGQTRRRQLIIGRRNVPPSESEINTFAGYGAIPREAEQAAYLAERDDFVWHYVTLTWSVPIVVMPQAELPL